MNSARTPAFPAAQPGPRLLGRVGAGVGVGHVAEALDNASLPSLSQILQHYREHGTVARLVATWNPTQSDDLIDEPPPARPNPFLEPIDGLHTRELDGSDLFEQFFGRDTR